ncbi:NAD-dependent epimerase/dehydratase family protein [Flavilitoribacter nigricans]|uniref:3-beta hydroxysteroid dehydrogenase n=1 Tax=Flavilitoribacter nigricans (strain ATCC 23147 / DSM 23189 / NBRC 102662 / NCIMB 1420 / SS-2) TaxID=1122177 RepID=A0A2D0N4E3_FLAN2|nr:NAD-dependent epimerase/dehydratase family protein [Flavilitoribacter nigricans]PHN03391.1 3-beta hydroxysteroid dehydrogenase [Flavilitoribacter nigricans DSM 23189 = NBRC 102662]
MSKTVKDAQILVTGGTGLVGSYLIRYLLQSGYTRIRALCRPDSKFDLLDGQEDRVEWVETDILDIIGVEEAMAGVQQVYHCAALVSFDKREKDLMLRTNRDGTANIVNAALYAGVEKLVHVSSVAAIGRDKKTTWVDEKTKWARSPDNTHYAISKFQAEQEVWRGQAEGLTVAVVNPAIILGAGYWDKGSSEFFSLAWKEFPFYPIGENGFVDVRDVARFALRLMESKVQGERFILSGTNLAFREMQETMARAMDRKPPRYRFSPFLGRWAARMEWLRNKLTGKEPLITRENVKMTSLIYHYRNDKSRRMFDFAYIPFERTIEETSDLFRKNQENGSAPRVLPLVPVDQ